MAGPQGGSGGSGSRNVAGDLLVLLPWSSQQGFECVLATKWEAWVGLMGEC